VNPFEHTGYGTRKGKSKAGRASSYDRSDNGALIKTKAEREQNQIGRLPALLWDKRTGSKVFDLYQFLTPFFSKTPRRPFITGLIWFLENIRNKFWG
jgi:hypothetical protein